MNETARFRQLLDKYAADTMEPGELGELMDQIASGQFDEEVDAHMRLRLHEEMSLADLPVHRAQDLMRRILSAEKNASRLIPLPARERQRRPGRWLAAALFAAILACGVLLWRTSIRKTRGPLFYPAGELVEHPNNGSAPLSLGLEDGSSVILQPGSRVLYPRHFSGGKREVYLDGEGFFEVIRDAGRPFFVYHGELVTHVLGTSFHIRMNKTLREAEVDVVSGKVEVFPNNRSTANTGVILTPNQRVIYHENDQQLVPSVVAEPMPVRKDTAAAREAEAKTGFSEAPLPEVLRFLQEKYGIEIVVENENMNKCLFTGDIGEESLYDQLRIICSSLSATYETKGVKILLKGNGCN